MPNTNSYGAGPVVIHDSSSAESASTYSYGTMSSTEAHQGNGYRNPHTEDVGTYVSNDSAVIWHDAAGFYNEDEPSPTYNGGQPAHKKKGSGKKRRRASNAAEP